MSKADFMVVSFSEEGEATALHREQFPLGFLGKQKIERASDIRFNDTTQLWDIYLLDPEGLVDIMGDRFHLVPQARGFASYDQARDVEVVWLENCALMGVSPFHPLGIEALLAARANNAI